MGWPIVGDAIYGNAPRAGGPVLHLHSREIVVPLYKNRAPISVTAPVPEHMRALLTQCGWPGEESDVPFRPRVAGEGDRP
jgi:tRNA pseudouridine32 synthase/23S rRNA pseudouridine746 synthase